MKLQILVNGHPVEVDAEELKEVSQVEPGVYSVLVEGRSFEVRAIAAPGRIAAGGGWPAVHGGGVRSAGSGAEIRRGARDRDGRTSRRRCRGK